MNEFMEDIKAIRQEKEERTKRLKRERELKRKRLYARKLRKVNHGRCI